MKINLTTLLTLLFVTLKLTNYIDWSWIWVLSPLWISASLYAFSLVLLLAFATIVPIKFVPRHKKKQSS